MEERAPRQIPVARAVAVERARAEVAAAVSLVATGSATRVALSNLPIDEDTAGEGAALAQRAGVTFSVTRDVESGHRVVRVGPRVTSER